MQRSVVASITLTPLGLNRLAVATADFGLHLLSKSVSDSEEIFPFGGGLRYAMICFDHPRFKNYFWLVVTMGR